MRGKDLRLMADKLGVVLAFGEEPLLRVGDTVDVSYCAYRLKRQIDC
jgi:hypothetical protein